MLQTLITCDKPLPTISDRSPTELRPISHRSPTDLRCVKRTPKTSKLVIVATTSSAATLESLELLDAFNVALHVPNLGLTEATHVLRELGVANISEIEPTLRTVMAPNGSRMTPLMDPE